jgi:flagellar basal-body rod protein FlgB
MRNNVVFVSDITSGGAFPMLEKTLAFTVANNRMLATNIANATTPGYRNMQLDVSAFQSALREAAEHRNSRGGDFRLPTTGQVRTNAAGRLAVTPSREPAENTLFQDGTNARIERQMALLAENAMMNQVTVEMLKGYYGGIAKAIRGRLR